MYNKGRAPRHSPVSQSRVPALLHTWKSLRSLTSTIARPPEFVLTASQQFETGDQFSVKVLRTWCTVAVAGRWCDGRVYTVLKPQVKSPRGRGLQSASDASSAVHRQTPASASKHAHGASGLAQLWLHRSAASVDNTPELRASRNSRSCRADTCCALFGDLLLG